MKKPIRKYILLLIGLTYFVSCNKEDTFPSQRLCADEYYYYAVGEKHYFKHSLYEVWIEFEQGSVTGEMAKSLLENYSFLNTYFSTDKHYDKFRATINKNCTCADFKNYLKKLNEDSEIFSATPIFYTSADDFSSYSILLSEVITEYDEKVISESEFINYAEGLNLELIVSGYSQYFRVKNVETGFEALEIANQIYESGLVKYSIANYISPTELY